MNFLQTPHLLSRRLKRHQLTAANTQVVWYECGAGTPLILLHGGFGNHLHWAKNIEFLAQSYRVLIPDMPGFGESDSPAEHSIEALLQPLLNTLHQLVRVDEVIDVLCFSFGGLVGSQLVIERGFVAHLAILGAVGHHVERRPRGEMQNWKTAFTAGDANQLYQMMQHNLWMHMIFDKTRIDADAVEIQTRACTASRFKSREISWSGGLFEKLEQITQSGTTPILIVWGEHDVTGNPAELVNYCAMHLPSVRVQVLPNAGHWIQYERSDELNSLLLDWLGT